MVEQNNILVTGTASGLGKHCAEYFHAVPYTRQTDFDAILKRAKNKPFNAIIHAAFDAKPGVDTNRLYRYLNDTILLTKKLIQIPHEKFIFISSIDVYPKKNESRCIETDAISLDEVGTLYAVSKLISESIVQNETENALIIRCSALLGKDAKKNSLMKIIALENAALTLSPQSTFNYILHTDMSHFIEKAIQQDLRGIYNLAASSRVSLKEIETHFSRQVSFGQYTYTTPEINNEKACAIASCFRRNSMENIELFLKDYRG